MICTSDNIKEDLANGLTHDQIISKYIGRIASNLLDQTGTLTLIVGSELGIPSSQHLVLTQTIFGAMRSIFLGLTLKEFPDEKSPEFARFITEMMHDFITRMTELTRGYSDLEITEMRKFLSIEDSHIQATKRGSN